MELLETIAAQLIEIPSVSGDAHHCGRVLDLVAGMLSESDRLYGTAIEVEGTRSLVMSTRQGPRSRVILSAHLDVVPARPEQFEPVVDGGVLRGRGAYDMKGAAAVYVDLLREVGRLPAEDRPDVQVHFVTDEEVGGHQGARVLCREGFTGEIFIAGEPTELGICHRAKGILWVTVRAAGRPGHGARPWEADNPIHFLRRGLDRLLERYPPPAEAAWRSTATPTALRAGEAHNRIPAEAVLKLDLRRVPEESEEEMLDFVQACFPGAALDIAQRADALDTDPGHPQVHRVARIQEQMTGQAPRLYAEHYGSDARYWSAMGVPAICWGPRGGGMHADDEWLDLDSLRLYARLVRRVIGMG